MKEGSVIPTSVCRAASLPWRSAPTARISVRTSAAPETSSQSMTKPSRCRRVESSMALAASRRISSSTLVALKQVRKTSSSVASLVSSRQFRDIFSIYLNGAESPGVGGFFVDVGDSLALVNRTRNRRLRRGGGDANGYILSPIVGGWAKIPCPAWLFAFP